MRSFEAAIEEETVKQVCLWENWNVFRLIVEQGKPFEIRQFREERSESCEGNRRERIAHSEFEGLD